MLDEILFGPSINGSVPPWVKIILQDITEIGGGLESSAGVELNS